VIKIVHIIAGLDADGAETVLYQLTSQMDKGRFQNEVISLTEAGPLADRLRAAGVPVRALGMKRGVPTLYHLLTLRKWLKQSQPSVVQTWMYHADLMGGVASHLAGRWPVVWGIHHSNLDPDQNKRMTIWTARTSARLSRAIPRRIVCCSESSREVHAKFGYASDRMEIIFNGFDLHQFHPDAEARGSFRRELGISENTPLVGMAARFHVQKDHRNFVDAAAHLHADAPAVHFVLCGRGADTSNAELMSWIEQCGSGLREAFHLLGNRSDMPRFFAALDIATSSSVSEAFPMAVGEAMACGVPCVVTDVGDSAVIVGDTGRVVPPSDSQALANAWRELLATDSATRRQMGQAARRRIEQKFSVDTLVERYQELYGEILTPAGSQPARRTTVASPAG
jgi:glycosyltransferase involved in cell wall biosynthesis